MKEKLISRFLAPHNSPVRKIRLHLERENIFVLNVFFHKVCASNPGILP
jgi:hypothetical protein